MQKKVQIESWQTYIFHSLLTFSLNCPSSLFTLQSLVCTPPLLNFDFPCIVRFAKKGTFALHTLSEHEIFILITAVTEQSCALLQMHFVRPKSRPCQCQRIAMGWARAPAVAEEMHHIVLTLSAARDSTPNVQISLLTGEGDKNILHFLVWKANKVRDVGRKLGAYLAWICSKVRKSSDWTKTC